VAADNHYFGEYRPLVVTHTGDSGIGSLRYVIEDALSRPQGESITFDISETDANFIDIDADLPGGDADPDIFLIQPLSPLPALDGTAGIWIDGGTYGESESNVDDDFPRIVIDGSLAGISNGLQILSDSNGIRGLGIQNFQGAGIHAVGSGNTIVANNLGVDILGGDAGNGGDGIWIESGSDNMIGGLDEGSKNVIAFNHGSGVSVEAGTGNQIMGNAFFQNLGLGIDLGRDGFTVNDVDLGFVDVDNGANDLLNTPVITRIEIVGDTVEVDYSVPTNAEMVGDSLRIEFFLADESRREGAIFVGSDEYTYEDFLQGGKTLQVDAEDLPSWDARVVATAISAQGGTSEFSAPRGIRFVGRSAEAEQQDAVDRVADGILGRLEALLSQTSILPPTWAPAPPTDSLLVTNPMIDKIYIGWGVAAEDETDRAIDLGRNENPLVAVGFGEEVDEITMAVNDFCVEQVLDLVDTLSPSPGQIVVAIWFDPINFTVSIGGNQVSYDYDNNPSQIVGNIPGASLVVTPQSPSTPGGVQGIMFIGNSSTIDIQMTTTSSGEMMRGGVNIYTVGSSGGGTTVQPAIRTAFQGNLPRDTIVMTFDPSAPASLVLGAGGMTTQSMMGLSSDGRAGGAGGAGGGLPVSMAGIFAGPNAFDLAFLDPVSLAESVLDISGTTVEDEDQEGEVEDLQNQVQDEYGNDLDGRDDDEEFSEDDRDDEEEDDFDDQDDDQPEDEEDIEETISVIFNLIGEALASDSGRVDVIEILEGDSGSSNQKQTQDARERDQDWQTFSTEFSTISIDRSGVAVMAGVEPAGPSRFLHT
jgi:hypothetical protein